MESKVVQSKAAALEVGASGHISAILMIDMTRFLDRLDMICERKINVKDDFKVYDLSNWKNGVIIYNNGVN